MLRLQDEKNFSGMFCLRNIWISTILTQVLHCITNQDIQFWRLRLCQFTTKFVNALLHTYHRYYARSGTTSLLETIYKLRELEQYLSSCRRALNFGRCVDSFYSAIKSAQLYDPVFRSTIATSKLWGSLQLFSEHVLWLQNLGLITADKQVWAERANRFWLYSVTFNLLRDFYELICVIQRTKRRSDDAKLLDDEKSETDLLPVRWVKQNPKLSCDLIKNVCDFCLPYSYDKKIRLGPSVVGLLGIISSTAGILQIYDRHYMLSPS